MEAQQPIIVIKKKGAHGGHHGGAWKVAYADFVTAMMSLFIVLWLMSSTSKATQEGIAGYFRDPKGTAKNAGAHVKPVEVKVKKEDMVVLKNDLLKAIQKIGALDKLKKQIEITVTDEGLRIEMLEDAKGTFFSSGSAQPTPVMEELLKVLSAQLKDLPNSISIEGHTDARPYAATGPYGNWELSTDRANVARREMQGYGIRLNQISQVRGFADQRLHVPDRPFDPANRRISLVVQNLAGDRSPTELASNDDAAIGSEKGVSKKAIGKSSGPDALAASIAAKPVLMSAEAEGAKTK